MTCPISAQDDPASAQKSPPSVITEFPHSEGWAGEGMPLNITLRAPSPFTGTAFFNLPRIPKTAFIKQGSPIVGSETIAGIEYYTQLHSFLIFTQQTGSVEIPSFQVRFEYRKLGAKAPSSVEGMSETVDFESKRPPGTGADSLVVTANSMTVNQTWSTDPDTLIPAGGILTRTIKRQATGTTAMLLSPFEIPEMAGVRIYSTEPRVVDKSERGESSAERVDTIKYQFERGGDFEIPELNFTWWNPDSSEVKVETFPGRTIKADGPVIVVSAAQKEQMKWIIPLIILALAGLLWLAWKPAARWRQRWHDYCNRPETLAARDVKHACAQSDATAAHQALLRWNLTVSPADSDASTALQQEQNHLSSYLYSGATQTRWDGSALASAFAALQRDRRQSSRLQKSAAVLPDLNPTR
tara:strand:- start:1302 stop:2537 length:1236 start_codon:yes stop_codon:yes gene_type:complete